MAYKKVGWNDYPSTDTPINATNLDHMDAGILENAQTIGDKTKISGIGDGTVAGAIAANTAAIEQNTQSLINKSTLIDLIYPVGSIFITIKPTNPGTYLGGAWTLLTDCFLLGAGNKYAVNKTGGEATHTLTASELPTHVHRILSGTGSASSGNYDGYISMGYIANNYDGNKGMITNDIFAGGHSNFCGNQAHNNMPPYYTVYMYRRDK